MNALVHGIVYSFIRLRNISQPSLLRVGIKQFHSSVLRASVNDNVRYMRIILLMNRLCALLKEISSAILYKIKTNSYNADLKEKIA